MCVCWCVCACVRACVSVCWCVYACECVRACVWCVVCMCMWVCDFSILVKGRLSSTQPRSQQNKLGKAFCMRFTMTLSQRVSVLKHWSRTKAVSVTGRSAYSWRQKKTRYTKRASYFDIGLFSPVVILTGCLASVDKRLYQNWRVICSKML